MSEQELRVRPVKSDQGNPTTSISERPLRICVVFDDDTSASSAEVLIRHVASEYECHRQSFSFDELDTPAPGVAAARSASESDIFVIAVRDERMLPCHVKSWLRLCIGMRDEDQDGALVVLIAESAQTSNPGASLLDYLETVAITGRLAFFSSQRGIDDRATPTRNQWELEDMICGLSN
jgi:hypothetical protein